jgi:hypothetical protein
MKHINRTTGYFKSLIDDYGIIQFTKIYEKDYECGYAIEDQARALIVAILLEDKELQHRLLSLILESRSERGGVKMIRSANGVIRDQVDNFQEASAEVLWALGEIQSHQYLPELEEYSHYLIEGLIQTHHPRAIAYALLGTTKLKDKKHSQYFANVLVQYYQRNAEEAWQWFDHGLTYANGILPWSLLAAYQLLGKKKYLAIGLRTLHFLLDHLKNGDISVLVGNNGEWWRKGQDMPHFDQQPIDAAYLVMACLTAYVVTSDRYFFDKAQFYYSWFEGNNVHGLCMIRDDGACFDGLHPEGVNLNGGAESTICYLMASIQLQQALKEKRATRRSRVVGKELLQPV